jgi:hypothetical protein
MVNTIRIIAMFADARVVFHHSWLFINESLPCIGAQA